MCNFSLLVASILTTQKGAGFLETKEYHFQKLTPINDAGNHEAIIGEET